MIGDWFGRSCSREEDASVIIFGVPYDGAVFFRKGAAQGPARIRALSSKIPPVTEDMRTIEGVRIFDAGDVFPEPDDESFRRRIGEAFTKARAYALPLALGGDHSISIPLFAAVDASVDGPYGVLWIDAHPDLCDTYDESRFSHACVLRRALEGSNLSPENVVMVGTRSFETEEVAYIEEQHISMYTARAAEALSPGDLGAELVERFRDMPVYLSIDIDGFDPAYAPGTGIPDAGGLSARFVLDLLHAIAPLDLLGVDIVEVAPPLDVPSDVTSLLALKLILELLGNLQK